MNIRLRTDGRYECRLYLGVNPITGHVRQRSFYGRTSKEALDKMLEARGKLLNGEYIEPNRMTVAQWLNQWYTAHVQSQAKPNTAKMYGSYIAGKIAPALGHIQLQRLTRENAQMFINEMQKTYAPATVRQIYTILHSALAVAVQNDYIKRNVADGLTLPHVDNAKSKTLTAAEIDSFCAALPDSTIGRMLHFIALTGLRVGEASALRWSDFDGNTYTVNQTVSRIKAEWVFGSPKSKAGLRTLPLPSAAKPIIDRQRKAQLEARLKCGNAWHDYNLVFASDFGEPLLEAVINRQMKKTLTAAGLPEYSVHDLRHAWGTAAIMRGHDPKTVSDMLGHESVETTLNRYTHTDMIIKRAVVDTDV